MLNNIFKQNIILHQGYYYCRLGSAKNYIITSHTICIW